MEDIRLAIDAYTLDTTAGKKRVQTIQQDGSLVYEQAKPAGADFAEEVERIWTEFSEGLLDITEAQLNALGPDDDAVVKPSSEEEEKEERDPGRMMSAREMEELRSEVYLQLNDARNELWYVLELAKTLAVSTGHTSDPPPAPNQSAIQKKRKVGADGPAAPALQPGVEPPILPSGTYTTTPARLPLNASKSVYDLELALAAKQEALDECSALIDNAVEELQAMAEAGDRFWSSLRTLRDGTGGRGQWAIVPRPDFGRSMAEGERAKDIIIPYALDEAPPLLRARSLAAFDLDPTKLDSVTFGARTHLRLRVTLHDQAGLHSSSLAIPPDGEDVRALMDFVQAEAVDEDLFNELRNEAIGSEIGVEGRRIAATVGDTEVVFDLYDIRTPPSIPSTSGKCDLILQIARLSLLNLHRHRKQQLITQASRLFPQYSPGPKILSPILEGLRYFQLVQSVLATLRMFADTAEKSGLHSVVKMDWADAGTSTAEAGHPSVTRGMEWGGAGDILDSVCGEARLEIAGLSGVRVTTKPLRPFTLHTSKASFSLSADISDLTSLVSADLASQMLSFAQTVLQGSLGDISRDKVFFDELAGLIALPEACLSIDIPPPYSSIEAKLEPDNPAVKVDAFDPQVSSLREWLENVSRHVA